MNRSTPVFNSQAAHTFKFPGVISHNNQSPTAGMTCDHLIKWGSSQKTENKAR